ncbi:MAG: hypothetical protein HY553_12480 [Elusimicrobia bacterium]|nr:hypothetical protein [Elusimicrobiota bacterium]
MRTLLAFFWAAGLAVEASAQAPNVATYQGRLQESGLPVSGNRLVEVRLCTALTGGTCFPTPETAAQGVAVLNGVFKTTLTIPTGVNLAAGPWYLELGVAAALPLNTLSPREALTSFPYAVYASSAATLLGTVLTSQIVPGLLDSAVVAQGFASGQVGRGALTDSAVDSTKLAAGAVETSRLATDSVDSSKLLAGAVQTSKLGTDAVDSTKIRNGAVQTSKLGTDSVDTTKILNGAVSTAKLADSAVNTSKLGEAAVTTVKLSDQAVTSAKLAPLSVDASKLASNAVTGPKIAATSIDTTKLLADSVVNSTIINFAVDTNKLGSGAVSTSKLGTAAVQAFAIADGAVGTAKITLGSIDTNRLANSAVTADKLAPGALLKSGIGLDRLGAMTRIGYVESTIAGAVQLGIPARKHVELFIHIPPLLSSTDVSIRFNTIATANYGVTRSTGGYAYSNINAVGIDMLGVAGSFATGSQVDIRLSLDGNSGSVSFVTGTFLCSAFQGVAFAPQSIQGTFGFNSGGPPVTIINVRGITANLPIGTYIAAYGEEFP